MNIGELKKALRDCLLPDETEIVIHEQGDGFSIKGPSVAMMAPNQYGCHTLYVTPEQDTEGEYADMVPADAVRVAVLYGR